ALHDGLPVCGRHQAEEVAGLGVVVVALAVVVAGGVALDLERGLGERGTFLGTAEGVGFVVGRDVAGEVVAHGAAFLVVEHGAARGVDGQLLVVCAEAIALGVGIGKDAGLKHLVGRVADAGDDVGGREGGLLDLGVVVARI